MKNRLLLGGINLSKIKKEELYTNDKGEKFLNLVIWVNDEKDQYGNIASIQQGLKNKDEKLYIGNLKEYEKTETQQESDDLPF